MRTRELSRTATLLLVAASFGPACIGGQTGDGEPFGDDNGPGGGNPSGPTTGHEGGWGCEYETEVVDDLDASGPGGFAPRAVIELADGTITTSLRWQSSEQLQLSPDAGQSELTIRIEHSGREVRLRRPVPPQGNGEELGPVILLPDVECPPGYEIDVELEFTTEGGAFAETFETTLVASSRDVVSFRQPIDHEALQGSFEVLGTLPPGGVVKQLAIGGILSPLGTYGNVDGVLEYSVPGDGSGDSTGGVTNTPGLGGAGLIASWPADGSCDDSGGSGLSIALDSDLGGQTLADAVAAANALFPRPLTWQVPVELPAAAPQADPEPDPGSEPGSDDSEPAPNPSLPMFEDVAETTLSLSIGASEAACARLEGGGFRVTLPVTLEASTEDGAWQGQYTGELSALSGDDELGEVMLHAALDHVSIGAFEASTGIADVELSGYDYARMQLWLDMDAVQGSLEVQGAEVADCVNNPPEPIHDENGNIVGSAGCRGTDLIVVRRARF